MDQPSSAVSHEALQRQAYLLWEAAGFPPSQSEHFWLMAEQQLQPDVSAPTAEAAPVHPTRRKTAARKAPVKAIKKPIAAAPAKPAAKTTVKSAGKAATPSALKTPVKSGAGPVSKVEPTSKESPPAKSKNPSIKVPKKKEKPKSGELT